jgi:simple sugar transport system ATP-binding protein
MSDAAVPAPETVLRLSGITKRFGPLVANDGITLELARGEVLALLGENGAGKSTLVSILFGHYVADAGTVEAFGRALPPGQPRAALAAGIGMVHQHFTLADNLSVLDNVMLGTEALWQPFSRRSAARARLEDAARRFGLVVHPDARVGTLSVGERQRVEILKALVRGARILILDEPTAVLTPQESEALFATLGQMVREGLSLIFISHKLDEVLRVSHRIAVLRAGRLVAERPAAGASKAMLAEAMVGQRVAAAVKRRHERGAVVAALPGTPLEVRAGEVVAVAGVAGNGQQALAEALAGERVAPGGALVLDGRAMPAAPRAWVRSGVARIPEDRHTVGAVGEMSLEENLLLERYAERRFARAGWLNRAAAHEASRALLERYDVRSAAGAATPARALSGGNLQKLILGRALGLGAPRLIVANQPTWGLDVGALAFVHQQLLDAAAGGAAVLLISEDLDEVLALADRITVIHQGRLAPLRPTAEWTVAAIGLAMAGSAAPETAHAA